MQPYEQYVKDNPDKFKRVQDYLDKQGVLCFEGIKQKAFPNIDAIWAVNCSFYHRTYRVRKLLFWEILTYQCRANARRSIGDIYRICKYYNPDITLADVYLQLCQYANNNKIDSIICTEINQRVWCISPYHNRFQHYEYDEYGIQYPELSLGSMGNINRIKHIKT